MWQNRLTRQETVPLKSNITRIQASPIIISWDLDYTSESLVNAFRQGTLDLYAFRTSILIFLSVNNC